MSTKKYRLAASINKVSYQAAPIRLTISNNDKPNWRSVSLNNRKVIEKVSSKSSPRWWLVLPCLLLITLTNASDPLLLNDLIIRRYERYYRLSASTDAQRAACRQSPTTPAPTFPLLYWQYPSPDQNSFQRPPDYNLAQRDAASFNVKNSIATLIPAVLTFLLLGSNSDIIVYGSSDRLNEELLLKYLSIFIGAGIVETIGHQAIGDLANDIYKASLQFFPGLIFLIFAVIGACPVVIMSYLAFAEARISKSTKRKPKTSSNVKPR